MIKETTEQFILENLQDYHVKIEAPFFIVFFDSKGEWMFTKVIKKELVWVNFKKYKIYNSTQEEKLHKEINPIFEKYI